MGCRHTWGFYEDSQSSGKYDEPLGNLLIGSAEPQYTDYLLVEKFEYCPDCGKNLNLEKKTVTKQQILDVIRKRMAEKAHCIWPRGEIQDTYLWIDIAQVFGVKNMDELMEIVKNETS